LLADFRNNKKKEKARQEQLRLQEEKRRAEEQRRLAERRKQEEQQRREESFLSNFEFDSTCHQRYENGQPVRGLQVCPRYIKIKKNINGCSGYQLTPGDGYILTATNGDTGQPQFAPKPMRVVKFSDSEILLKGYCVSAQTPFGWQEIDLSDYGFSIILEKNVVKKCILFLYDRNVKLEYMVGSKTTENSTNNTACRMVETESLVVEALKQLSIGNNGDETYHPLYKSWRSYKDNPEQLKNIKDFGHYGMGLMIFLSYGTISDIDDRQQLASLAYLFISKAIKQNSANANLFKNRLLLMITNHEAFEYTVSSVVNKDQDFFSMNLMPFQARDAMFKMEYADLSFNRALLSIDILASKYQDLQTKINSGFFGKESTNESIISTGMKTKCTMWV
jgi:hypothetical protein